MHNGSGDREQTLQLVRSVMAQMDDTFQRQENMLKLSYADLNSRLEQLRGKVLYHYDERGGMGSALAGSLHSPHNTVSNGLHNASPFSVTAPGEMHSSTPIRSTFPAATATTGNSLLNDRLGFGSAPGLFSTGQGSKVGAANTSTPMREPGHGMNFAAAPGSGMPERNDWSSLSMLQHDSAAPGPLPAFTNPDPSIMGSPQASGKLTLDDLLARFAGGPSPSTHSDTFTNPFGVHDGEISPVVNFDSIYEEIVGAGREDSYPGMRGTGASSGGNTAGGYPSGAPHTPSKLTDPTQGGPAGAEKNTIPIDMLRSLHDQHLTTSVRAVYENGRPKVVPIPDAKPEDPATLGIDPTMACRVLVEFKRKRVLQYDSDSYVAPGRYVVVGGDRGEDLGLVIYTWCETTSDDTDGETERTSVVGVGLSGSLLTRSMGVGNGTVLRSATETEVDQLYGSQAELERRAVDVCAQRVLDHGLPMVIADAEYQFDKKKLTFFYEAQQRMDFRELVRDLYKTFRARIWMELVDK